MHTDFTFFDDTKGAQRAQGLDFKNDSGDDIENRIAIHPTKSTIDQRYDLMLKPEAEECLAKFFDAEIKQRQQQRGSADATIGEATVRRFTVSGIGDRGIGFRVAVSITTADESGTFYGELLAVPRGRAGITLISQAFGAPPNRGTEIALLKLMSDRLGKNAP